jgi:hypothetical protein
MVALEFGLPLAFRNQILSSLAVGLLGLRRSTGVARID